MPIPKLKPTARKAEAFTSEAPDAKREYKLRGKKQPLALNLPPDLIAQVDQFAAEDRRSRSHAVMAFSDNSPEWDTNVPSSPHR